MMKSLNAVILGCFFSWVAALITAAGQVGPVPASNATLQAVMPTPPRRPQFVVPHDPPDIGMSTSPAPAYVPLRPGRPRCAGKITEPLDVGISTGAAYVLEGPEQTPVIVVGQGDAGAAACPEPCVKVLTHGSSDGSEAACAPFSDHLRAGGQNPEENSWEYVADGDQAAAVSFRAGDKPVVIRLRRLEYVSENAERTTVLAKARSDLSGEEVSGGLYVPEIFDAVAADLLIAVDGPQAELRLIFKEVPDPPEDLGEGARLRVVWALEGMGENGEVVRPGDAEPDRSLPVPVRLSRGDGDQSLTLCFPVSFAYAGAVPADSEPAGCGESSGMEAICLSVLKGDQEWLLYQEVPLARIEDAPFVLECVARPPVEVGELRFQRGVTYFLDGPLALDGGRLVLEPGTIVKLPPGAGIYVGAGAEVSFRCHALEPAYVTSCFDDGVGAALSGVVGEREGSDRRAGAALVIIGATGTVRGLEIRHARRGLVLVGAGQEQRVRDVRIADCCEGIAAIGQIPEVQLHNCLIYRTRIGLYTVAERATIDFSTFAEIADAVIRGAGNCTIRDSVIAQAESVASWDSGLRLSYERAAFYSVRNTPGDTVGAIFLADSPFAGAGDFHLAADSELHDRSTRSAAECGLFHFSTEPEGNKEGTGRADIGYHYAVAEDTDGDGAADVLEDGSGDGVAGGRDPSNWLVADRAETVARLYGVQPETAASDAGGTAAGPVEVLFVDATRGSDAADGTAPVSANGHGPLRTLRCALGRASGTTRIVAAEGVYTEGDLVIGADGQVVIKPTRITVIR